MVPFEQGPSFVVDATGLRVSVSTIRQLTEAAGAALCAVEAAEIARIERTLPEAPRGAEVQLVTTDGAMVPLVRGEWREVRTLAVGRISRSATGEVVTNDLSYVCRMSDAESFAAWATGELHRRGTEHAVTVAAVADGAPWCQSFFDLHVPGGRRILDFPHAVQHLSVVAQAVFGSGSAAASEWLGVHRHELRHGSPEQVIAAVAALPVETAADPEEARSIRDRELAYFSSRRAQIAYADFAAAGLPLGSGASESANKLVVEARLKGSGMHWAPDHVNPMLALRAGLCSHRWHESWTKLSAHQTRRLRPARPNTPAPALPEVTPLAPLPPPTPREKTIVNGRPTGKHPWNASRPRRQPVETTLQNC